MKKRLNIASLGTITAVLALAVGALFGASNDFKTVMIGIAVGLPLVLGIVLIGAGIAAAAAALPFWIAYDGIPLLYRCLKGLLSPARR